MGADVSRCLVDADISATIRLTAALTPYKAPDNNRERRGNDNSTDYDNNSNDVNEVFFKDNNDMTFVWACTTGTNHTQQPVFPDNCE